MHIVETTVRNRFRNVVAHGSHMPDGVACVLELAHIAANLPWSERPDRWPDLRPLNDGPWSSDARRTAGLVPVLVAYWDWANWASERRKQVINRVIIATVHDLISQLPGLPAHIIQQCQTATNLSEAQMAAEAAEAAAGAAA